MRVKKLSHKNGEIVLLLEGLDVSYANALRRTAIAEVPTLAIEEVEFHGNTSSFYDEIIAHRLGLIPIKTDLKLFNYPESCACGGKGCPSCTLRLTLSKAGPGMVYSDDLKPEVPGMEPVKGIPILKLGKGQKISLQAVAVLGNGRRHAKWQPAIAGYKYYPEIEVSKDCILCEECVNVCPRNVLKVEKGKISVVDEKKCILCRACVDACEYGAIEVRGNPKKFIFRLETTGALPPEEIFNKACEIMESKARELHSLL
jgi:DNA-directed RNA polymerase subunit D